MKRAMSGKKIAFILVPLIGGAVFFASSPTFATDINVALQIPISGKQSIQVCVGNFCGGIGEYISIIYQWAVAFAAVLAVLAFSFAGILWLVAGGDQSKTSESKKIMGNAIMGLLLALGSYLALTTINPGLVHFQPIRVPAVKSITLNLTPASIIAGGITVNYSVEHFTARGFPPPNTEADPGGKKMTGDTLVRWNTYKDLAMKASTATGTDIGFIGMWPLLENDFDTFMDNCADRDSNPNTPCASWGSNWQVGLGVHPGNMINSYESAFTKMYGDASDATVQRVGQSVLDAAKAKGKPLTIIGDTFPNISLSDTITKAKNGDQTARLHIATLTKDPALGLYLVGVHFGATDVGREPKDNMADRMNGWPPAGTYTPQRISNLIKMIYDAK